MSAEAYHLIVSLVKWSKQLLIILCDYCIISPEPNRDEGHYTIIVTIDGKTFYELGGTTCNGCYFDVSPYVS